MFSAPLLTLAIFTIFGHALPVTTPCDEESLVETLKNLNVIPDVLPEFQAQFSLGITTVDGTSVTPGLNLTVNQTAVEPTWSIHPSYQPDSQSFKTKSYTIMLVDPDAPTPQNASVSDIVHFIQTDAVPGDNGALTFQSDANPIVPYAGPAPPADSDAHRYVSILYEQVSGLGSIKPPAGFPTNFTDINNRLFFNATKFAEEVEGTLKLVSANVWFTAADA
ncbi:phosphatidylethanolamine-binding protein [Flagelloscypha sp. PMI_526]|nr:phosphatidylethanolamine-binding protein [Flagelloscypha sp. PMI_526]